MDEHTDPPPAHDPPEPAPAGAAPAPPAAAPSDRPWRALVAAALAGFAAEALVHGQPPGLGVAVAGAALAAGALLGGPLTGLRPGRQTLVLAAPLAFFSAMVAVRGGALLTLFNLLACGGLVLLLAADFHVSIPLHRLPLAGLVLGLARAALAAAFLPFAHIPALLRRPPALPGRAPLGPVLRGAALALPLLLLFAALFASADAVFADYLSRLLDWDVDWSDASLRLLFSLVFSWGALGLLRHAAATRVDADPLSGLPRPAFLRLGAGETITTLALVNLLFLAFVLVQSAYLFGGADTLARAKLTYSEYARRGFFELVAVGAIVTGLALALDWLATPGRDRRGRTIDGLQGLLLALTLAVLASALQRMRLYTEAYGLTELRLYTTVFMLWIAFLLAWLAATVLRRRRGAFPAGALAAGALLMAGVNLLNPDAYIARTNLGRAGPLKVVEVEPEMSLTDTRVRRRREGLDVEYVTVTLSPDAVPALVEGIEGVRDAKTRARLAAALLQKRSQLEASARETGWRGWNRGRAEALRALREAEPRLRRLAEGTR